MRVVYCLFLGTVSAAVSLVMAVKFLHVTSPYYGFGAYAIAVVSALAAILYFYIAYVQARMDEEEDRRREEGGKR